MMKNNYSQWFQEVQYNGKTLSDSDREQCVAVIDEMIASYSQGLSLIYELLKTKDRCDGYHEIERIVNAVGLFVLTTMIDSMVAVKYFLLADGDYDRRFMRGKLLVILNEGFKQLYGFEEKTQKKSMWSRLLPFMKNFSETINYQYLDLTNRLESLAKSSSWWKEERNIETHLDTEKMYVLRQEEIIESKVVIDSMRLFSALLAVSDFLEQLNQCLLNCLIKNYNCRDLKEK